MLHALTHTTSCTYLDGVYHSCVGCVSKCSKLSCHQTIIEIQLCSGRKDEQGRHSGSIWSLATLLMRRCTHERTYIQTATAAVHYILWCRQRRSREPPRCPGKRQPAPAARHDCWTDTSSSGGSWPPQTTALSSLEAGGGLCPAERTSVQEAGTVRAPWEVGGAYSGREITGICSASLRAWKKVGEINCGC